MNKHAYMIMAHHRPDLLQLLINSLDDERNDIIVHIDKKSNMKPEQFETQYAKITCGGNRASCILPFLDRCKLSIMESELYI